MIFKHKFKKIHAGNLKILKRILSTVKRGYSKKLGWRTIIYYSNFFYYSFFLLTVLKTKFVYTSRGDILNRVDQIILGLIGLQEKNLLHVFVLHLVILLISF